jgi:hypothetical protein
MLAPSPPPAPVTTAPPRSGVLLVAVTRRVSRRTDPR